MTFGWQQEWRLLPMRTMRILLPFVLLAGSASAFAAESPAGSRSVAPSAHEHLIQQRGRASYYGDEFHGRKTATGEVFNQNKLTAASRSLPLGSVVTVTNVKNGKSVKV